MLHTSLEETMADLPLTSTTLGLAGRAADLSSELSAVQATCGHTSADVESVANEIAMLAATLWRLHEAINEDPNRYTESFNQDLAEITLELKTVFEEIAECCEELQKADPTSGNAVSWLFKKSKVHHLQKHLEALKTTLVVMRTVLHHGKEYGTQT
jgi:chromosome segregation ATPase